MYNDYLNYTHGLELWPENTTGWRGNENGIMFLSILATIMAIKGADLTKIKLDADLIIGRMEVKPGLFNRGSDDDLVNYKFRRTMSHDDNRGISSLSKLFGFRYARDIYRYGLRHFFCYNNVKPRLRPPYMPGQFISLIKLGGGDLLSTLLLPIYIFDLSQLLKSPKDDTSGKLLRLIELYPLRFDNIWGSLWLFYVKGMENMYGKYWLNELMVIYFRDQNHPCRTESVGVVIA